MTSKTDKEQLEKYQRLCLRTINAHVEGCSDCLATQNIVKISTTLYTACRRYVNKDKRSADPPLQNYTIEQRSNRSGRASTTAHHTAFIETFKLTIIQFSFFTCQRINLL